MPPSRQYTVGHTVWMNGGLKGHEQITDKSCDPSKSSQLMVDGRAVYVTESQRDIQQQQPKMYLKVQELYWTQTREPVSSRVCARIYAVTLWSN